MLYLYQSNHLETLCGALSEILSTGDDHPLQPETIVVQHQGMERWLSQQIAASKGIAANLNFPLPAAFIWNVLEQTLDHRLDISAFRQEVMLWRIMQQLSEAKPHTSMQKIGRYLEQDSDGRKQFQLAQKLTALFDQYQVYRPEMLLEWERNVVAADEDSQWQATLWQNLSRTNSNHWAAMLKRFELAHAGNKLNTKSLPSRVCFFGIDSLAPAYLNVIHQLSTLIDIHLFQLSPCADYWDDILPERVLSIKRKQWREQLSDFSDYFSSGNPLLASMGQAGQEFAKMSADLNARTLKLYQAPQPHSLLCHIQNDILNAHDRGRAPDPGLPAGDRSIQFHSCHSPMREIQVLHDRLLDLFAADANLKPADILVMAPDIDTYAPIISSVFDANDERLAIPWSITDLSGHQGQAAIEAFMALLELSNSRYTAPDVMTLLENPLIMTRFGFDESHISSMRAGIRDAGVRWGLDHRQRKQQGLDDTQTHTWEFGLQRLLMSYLTGPLDQALSGILPLSARLNHSAGWLGGLAEFIDGIQTLRQALQGPHTRPADWYHILKNMLADFLQDNEVAEHQQSLRQLRESIEDFNNDICQANFDQSLDLNIIHHYFEQRLTTAQARQGFLKGGVSFCKLTPMRALPSKVICLLGMNDTRYPRIEHPQEFDLIHAYPRLGDRSRRDSDHYLFLEILQSARQALYIFWQGQHQKTNDELPPSVVVAELRDYIDRGWQHNGTGQEENDSARRSSTQLTIKHPLQAFSSKCYDGTAATASYAAQWQIQPQLNTDSRFIRQPLETSTDDTLEIDTGELVRFWGHPVRYFLQQRLGLNLWQQDDSLAESEVFVLDALQQYHLNQSLISDIIRQQLPEPAFHRLQAAGDLPRGLLGQQLYETMRDTANELVCAMADYTQHPVSRIEVSLTIADGHIRGWLDQLDQRGRYSFRLASPKGKDMLQLWIQHLLLLLADNNTVAPVSRHFSKDKILTFAKVDDPQAELAPFIKFYRLGLKTPLHFFPDSSLAWAKAKPESARNSAQSKWLGSYYPGEHQNPSYQIAFRGQPLESLIDNEFEQLSALFHPILSHLE